MHLGRRGAIECAPDSEGIADEPTLDIALQTFMFYAAHRGDLESHREFSRLGEHASQNQSCLFHGIFGLLFSSANNREGSLAYYAFFPKLGAC